MKSVYSELKKGHLKHGTMRATKVCENKNSVHMTSIKWRETAYTHQSIGKPWMSAIFILQHMQIMDVKWKKVCLQKGKVDVAFIFLPGCRTKMSAEGKPAYRAENGCWHTFFLPCVQNEDVNWTKLCVQCRISECWHPLFLHWMLKEGVNEMNICIQCRKISATSTFCTVC